MVFSTVAYSLAKVCDHQVYHMCGPGIGKTCTHYFVEERGKIRAQDRTTELEEFHLQPFLICDLATSHESNGLTNPSGSKQVAMRRGIEMDKRLVGDIIKRGGMGGEGAKVKGGRMRGMVGEKGTLEKLGL